MHAKHYATHETQTSTANQKPLVKKLRAEIINPKPGIIAVSINVPVETDLKVLPVMDFNYQVPLLSIGLTLNWAKKV